MTDPAEAEAVVHADGRLVFAGRVYHAALGRAGLRQHKQEGDGGTPIGLLPIRRVYWRADRLPPPRTMLPREPLAPDDGWCDDPTHAHYNQPIRLPHPARHESLWRDDGLYNIVAVLGWNDTPVERGRGSAIFLHVARPDLAPTDGCIALPPADLLAVLAAGLRALRVAG